jgi:hypothetical protein
MFRTALVATDLSHASDHVVSCLHWLRTLGTEQVVLCTCWGPGTLRR